MGEGYGDLGAFSEFGGDIDLCPVQSCNFADDGHAQT